VTAYLLDTDICIYALQGDELVLGQLLSKSPSEVCVSVVTECELRTGAEKSRDRAKNTRAINHFLRPLQVVELSSDDAPAYARIRAQLERAGTKIGAMDLLIAAQAVSRRMTLVTNNEREFTRILDLEVENWTR
jgi:tRNA(fMet)-specific endonuclease VapC